MVELLAMNINKRIQRLLLMSGLKPDEAALYAYILENKGCSIMDAATAQGIPKTTAYRAYDALQGMDLVRTSGDAWKNSLEALPAGEFIKKLENEQKNRRRAMNELKVLFSLKDMPETDMSIPQIEEFKGDKALEKYLDLSEMNWHTNISFGNWEDLNVDGHLIPVEKKFIKNRLKKGANAVSYLMKGGDCTSEITDYDKFEERVSKTVNEETYKPLWVNAFEGNDYVYIWTLDDKRKLLGTFIDSEPVADFYRNHVYSKVI